MSLTSSDLYEIRSIVEDVVGSKIKPLQDEIAAPRNDVIEIYDRISDLENKTITDKKFEKLTIEQKILKINSELITAARQVGISLHR